MRRVALRLSIIATRFLPKYDRKGAIGRLRGGGSASALCGDVAGGREGFFDSARQMIRGEAGQRTYRQGSYGRPLN